MARNVGLIGVGLMGHGLARNILKHGHALTLMAHPGNRPLDELLAAGARTCDTAAEVARASDVVILCVTGTPEVEAVLSGPGGVLEGLRPGATVVDCSTAVPDSTMRMAALVEGAGGRFLDAPMTRTAQHAHAGTLNLLVGGAPETLEAVRPILDCFAESVTHCGTVGAGHRMKLLHNFVSIGTVSLVAEAAACAERAGVAMDVFVEVLASGGGGGVALERLRPYLLHKDASGLPFSLGNALKDVGYYARMARDADAAHAVADGVSATLEAGMARAGAGTMLPELASLLGS
jgi:3-hydroxyisobutyrate dehydrogenase-like beta-hydroxyacid dehydrogenase